MKIYRNVYTICIFNATLKHDKSLDAKYFRSKWICAKSQ